MLMRDRLLVVLMAALVLAATPKPTWLAEPSYLPDAAASRVVTVTEEGAAAAGVTVLTEAVAIKETRGLGRPPRGSERSMRSHRPSSPSIGMSPPRSAYGISSPTTTTISCWSVPTLRC